MPSVTPERVASLKRRACARIDEVAPALVDVSRKIWEHPEVAFQEHDASRWLAGLLRDAGYEVKTREGGLDTAFTALRSGAGRGPTVGVFSEYDALPELGHGCGHNLLAISGVGAGLGLAAVLGDLPGAVRIHGTPAEEGPSGKTLLLRAGVFEGLDAALIFHPADEASVLERMRTGQGIVFTFTGKHAHAAAHPELAVDALTGVLTLFNNVNLLRQHFRPDVSVTGSVLEGGGRRAFPVVASARFVVRVFECESDFGELREMVVNCARGAALATRTQLDVEYGILERGMKLNETLTAFAVDNARGLGIDLGRRVTMGGMSDFGNVSHLVPATHFSTATWPTGVTAHTKEAVAASCAPRAFEAALAAAKIEAMTTIDFLANPGAAERAKTEFRDNDLGDIPVVPDSKGGGR
jgi:amidohydrolase